MEINHELINELKVDELREDEFHLASGKPELKLVFLKLRRINSFGKLVVHPTLCIQEKL